MQKPIIVFFGNSKYSLLGLEVISKGYFMSHIVTIADSPVLEFAQKNSISYTLTKKITEENIAKINALNPDFLIVEDYGLILPQSLLDIPNIAPLNIHHSLLPKFRGPSPAPFTILAGKQASGVSIIKMTNKVDSGDILAQKEYQLKNDETTDSLLTILNKLGGELMVDIIKQYLDHTEKPVSQEESRATYSKFMKKEDGYINLEKPPEADVLDRMIRAYYPWPTVWTRWNGKIVKFLPSSVIPSKEGIQKTEETHGSRIKSGMTTEKYLLQMEGKKPVSIKDFLNGYPDFPLKFNS